jgi:hypothetical protein
VSGVSGVQDDDAARAGFRQEDRAPGSDRSGSDDDDVGAARQHGLAILSSRVRRRGGAGDDTLADLAAGRNQTFD